MFFISFTFDLDFSLKENKRYTHVLRVIFIEVTRSAPFPFRAIVCVEVTYSKIWDEITSCVLKSAVLLIFECRQFLIKIFVKIFIYFLPI